MALSDKTREILTLAQKLIKIPSVTVGSVERLDEVRRAEKLVSDYLLEHELEVRLLNECRYPAVLAGFPGQLLAPVMLSGHYDVVAPEPDDSQFEARVEGDYLWGRGAADMKTVVATFLVWMKDACRQGSPYPGISLLLVGNEENGETAPMGTPFVLEKLRLENGYQPEFLVAGERTEETGTREWGQICIENRGVARWQVIARGTRAHSGMASGQKTLIKRLIAARTTLSDLADRHLTLTGNSPWKSQIRFPFIQVGTPGVYNITPGEGTLGVEIRAIPQDDVAALFDEFREYCQAHELEITDRLLENGIACDPQNPHLKRLIEAVQRSSGQEPAIGRKLAGTSARFAPGGNGVVWGQSGVGPHSRDERHYIPSILPYYRALMAFGKLTVTGSSETS